MMRQSGWDDRLFEGLKITESFACFLRFCIFLFVLSGQSRPFL
jgi:hypothetical protein